MGKSVARIRFKGSKGKRWKKGQSSSSNPVLSSFREAAKNRFFAPASGQSNLTLDAISKHNAENNDCEMDEDLLEDEKSLKAATAKSEHHTIAKTANTWASDYTDCTNATFGRVHRFSVTNSAMHKEIIAVLAAVTEVIKQRGGGETETEYFAALMTALETVDNEESISAIMYLLTLCIKRLPLSVVRTKFSDISKAFMVILENHHDTDTPALLRSAIICLASVLRMQDLAVWSYSSTEKTYDTILRYIIHPKPRVRKAAHQAVRAILNGSDFMVSPNRPDYHPIAAHTAKYCIYLLEKDVSDTSTVLSLHVLTLLKEIMSILPSQALKSTCETILKLLTLADVMLTSVAMKALHGMFSSNPDEKSLPADLNARLITALYDYQPNVSDSQPLNAWLTVLEKAVIHLNQMDSSLSAIHLHRIFEISMKCLLTEKPETIKVASKAIRTLLYDCVRPNVESMDKAVLSKLFSECEKGLGYQYHSAWGQVVQFLSAFIQILKPTHFSFTIECLQSVAELRASDGFPYQKEVDQCIGQAVKTFGPRKVLEAVPLKITGVDDDYDFPRSWLLPVLRENICNTELSYFSTYFLPLAAKLRNNATHFMEKKQHLEAKTYGTLYLQIWSLLPGFCTNPTDLVTAFKGIAKTMGTVIGDQKDLRQEVMSSLRKLVNFSLKSEDSRKEIGHFAKNFLPIFLNLYTSSDIEEKARIRLAILETIKCYLQVCDSKIISAFFEKCHNNLQDKDLTSFKRHALLDIILPMIVYLEKDNLQNIFDIAMTNIQSKDRTNEKKSYRLLEELFSVPKESNVEEDGEGEEEEKQVVVVVENDKTDHRKLYIESNIDNLMTFFTNSLGKSNPSSKAPRLRCLISIFKQIDTQQFEFLSSILPEIVLCTKEEGESARKSSFIALKAMGSVMLRWVEEQEDDNKQEAITEFFTMLLAGLGGNPHMVSCSLLSLTAVTFKFKEYVSDKLLETLVSTLTILLTSPAREIVHSAMGLIKCIFTVFTDTKISPFLKPIVASVIAMKEDCQKYLRVKIKEMFVKWTRKYGYDLISSMVPESHRKMLKNIKKTQERIERKKSGKNTEGGDVEMDDQGPQEAKPSTLEDILRDTDSEVEEDDDNRSVGTAYTNRTGQTARTNRTSRSARSAKAGKDAAGSSLKDKKPMQGAAWLKDGANIVDFLDPSVASHVMASKPKKNKAPVVEEGEDTTARGFKIASDGKLIISEAKNDDDAYRTKKHVNDDDDDLDEIMASMGVSNNKGNRKRKYRDDYNEGMSDFGSTTEYKAGGEGIHRDLTKKRTKPGGGISRKDAAENYRAKKATGDVKKTGKHEPYAYVPLEFSTLNKRKQAKQSGKFTNLIKGAKKGSRMGQKLHARKHTK